MWLPAKKKKEFALNYNGIESLTAHDDFPDFLSKLYLTVCNTSHFSFDLFFISRFCLKVFNFIVFSIYALKSIFKVNFISACSYNIFPILVLVRTPLSLFNASIYQALGSSPPQHFHNITDLIIYMKKFLHFDWLRACLLYTSPSPRDLSTSRMPSSA